MRGDMMTDAESEGEGARPMPHVSPANAYYDSDEDSDAESDGDSWYDHPGAGAFDEDEDEFEIDEELEKNTEVIQSLYEIPSSSPLVLTIALCAGQRVGDNAVRPDPEGRADHGLPWRRAQHPPADRPHDVLVLLSEPASCNHNRLAGDHHAERAAARQPSDGKHRPAEIDQGEHVVVAAPRIEHVQACVRKEPLHRHFDPRRSGPSDRRSRTEEAQAALPRRE